jgi:hypothetical protein
MKNPILEHINLFAKGIVLTVGVFLITIFFSEFYERHLLTIMPPCITWFVAVFTILWPFIGLIITFVKSIKFIIKNILLADLSNCKLAPKEMYLIGVILEGFGIIACMYMIYRQIYNIVIL